MSEPTLVEYRIVRVNRYVVTRYESRGSGSGGVAEKGEFGNAQIAHEVAYALAKDEHERLGWPLDDPRFQYPKWDQNIQPEAAGQFAATATNEVYIEV